MPTAAHEELQFAPLNLEDDMPDQEFVDFAFLQARTGTSPEARTARGTTIAREEAYAAYRGLKFSEQELSQIILEISSLERREKASVLGFAGSRAGEGASTIIANLALGLHQYGRRVLLVDLALEHSHLCDLFSVRRTPGLIEAMRTAKPPNDSTIKIAESGIALLPLGSASNGANLDWVAAMRAIRATGREFDFTLIDFPPLCERHPILQAARKTDGIILIVQANHTRVEAALAARDEVTRLGSRVLGAILNRRKLYLPKWIYEIL